VFKTKEMFWIGQADAKTFTATIDTLVLQFYSAPTLENIRRRFARTGFSYNTGTAPDILEFSKERMIESAGLRQVWGFEVSLEKLSMRRQNARFGFINEKSFQCLTQPNQHLIE
jgi:hypothetical protein